MTMTASEASSTRRATRRLCDVRRSGNRGRVLPRVAQLALRRERRLTFRNCPLSSASTRSVRRFGMARTTVARAAARATMARAKLAQTGCAPRRLRESLRALGCVAAPNGRTSPQRMRGRPPTGERRRCRQRREVELACACAGGSASAAGRRGGGSKRRSMRSSRSRAAWRGSAFVALVSTTAEAPPAVRAFGKGSAEKRRRRAIASFGLSTRQWRRATPVGV